MVVTGEAADVGVAVDRHVDGAVLNRVLVFAGESADVGLTGHGAGQFGRGHGPEVQAHEQAHVVKAGDIAAQGNARERARRRAEEADVGSARRVDVEIGNAALAAGERAGERTAGGADRHKTLAGVPQTRGLLRLGQVDALPERVRRPEVDREQLQLVRGVNEVAAAGLEIVDRRFPREIRPGRALEHIPGGLRRAVRELHSVRRATRHAGRGAKAGIRRGGKRRRRSTRARQAGRAGRGAAADARRALRRRIEIPITARDRAAVKTGQAARHARARHRARGVALRQGAARGDQPDQAADEVSAIDGAGRVVLRDRVAVEADESADIDGADDGRGGVILRDRADEVGADQAARGHETRDIACRITGRNDRTRAVVKPDEAAGVGVAHHGARGVAVADRAEIRADQAAD